MPNNLDNLNNKIPWPLYIILFVLMLLIVVFGGIFLYQKINHIDKNASTTASVSKTSNIEIIKANISWIDSQKIQEDGSYPLNIDCSNENCTGSGDTFRVIPFIAWGKYQNFTKTGDQSILASIETDLGKLNGTQYGSWNCKLLYDIQKDSKISDYLKKKAKDGCQFSGYEVFLSEKRLDPVVLEEDLKNNINDVLNETKTKLKIMLGDEEKNNLISNFDRYSSYVSEVYYHDLWGLTLKTNSNLKDEAKQAFNRALEGYLLTETNYIPKDQMLGIAALDLYQFTNDRVYLDLANYIHNKNKDTKITNLSSFIYNYFFLKQLSEVTKKDYLSDQNFKQSLTSIPAEFYNPTAKAFGSNNSYSVPENALMSGILSINE